MIKKFEKLYCLKSSLGNKGWIEDKDIIKPYLLEDRGLYKGYSSLLLRPKSAKEVGQILSICNQNNIKVVPQGGRTGLCGGTIPSESGEEILISMERMNKIKQINKENFTITTEAGCILNKIQEESEKNNLLFPLSSC